jgi:hypothetical protein
MEKGIRVGAVMHADNDGVKFFGWGTYQGHEVPGPEVAGFMGHALRENKIPNPKILLDNGKVVWGCECWWGPEAEITKMIGGRKVEEVDIEALRAEHEAAAAEASGAKA